MRTIQTGSSNDLVLLYLVGQHLDADIRRALGPGPHIVAFDDAQGQTPAAVASKLGLDRVRSLVTIGYSAGTQAVRAALRTGSLPLTERLGIVVIDGTHASIPPEPWQIRIWQLAAEQARRSEKLFVATCTAQVYTENLPAGQRFLSTLSVLRQAIDPTLAPSAPPDERHEGDLHVYAYASKTIDKDAHIAQQREVLPDMLARHVRPWLGRGQGLDELMREAPPRSLGERALAVMRQKLGQREHGGENWGEVVRWALRGAVRRVDGREVPLGVLEGDWCAGSVGASEAAAAFPGEALPPWRGAVWELVRDAREAGTWREVDAYDPQPGDLAIFARAGEDPKQGGRGHVGRVARAPDSVGCFATIDGNVNDAITQVARQIDLDADPVLGWIVRTERRGLDAQEIAQVSGAVAVSLDRMARDLA
jgi:hypothetical protein